MLRGVLFVPLLPQMVFFLCTLLYDLLVTGPSLHSQPILLAAPLGDGGLAICTEMSLLYPLKTTDILTSNKSSHLCVSITERHQWKADCPQTYWSDGHRE